MQNFTITTDLIIISLSSLCLLFIFLTFVYSLKINKACRVRKYKDNFVKKDSLSAKEIKDLETKTEINSELAKPQKETNEPGSNSKPGNNQTDSKLTPGEERITKQYKRYLINGKINKDKEADERKIDWK
jgi:hypothetical protein